MLLSFRSPVTDLLRSFLTCLRQCGCRVDVGGGQWAPLRRAAAQPLPCAALAALACGIAAVQLPPAVRLLTVGLCLQADTNLPCTASGLTSCWKVANLVALVLQVQSATAYLGAAHVPLVLLSCGALAASARGSVARQVRSVSCLLLGAAQPSLTSCLGGAGQ